MLDWNRDPQPKHVGWGVLDRSALALGWIFGCVSNLQGTQTPDPNAGRWVCLAVGCNCAVSCGSVKLGSRWVFVFFPYRVSLSTHQMKRRHQVLYYQGEITWGGNSDQAPLFEFRRQIFGVYNSVSDTQTNPYTRVLAPDL